ncbi:MAG: preprotein translocase subunit SecE [Byssovorax sp.]
MAQRQQSKQPKVEEEPEEGSSDAEEGSEDALARTSSPDHAPDDAEQADDEEASDPSAEEESDDAEADEAEGEEGQAAAVLGTERYVLAGFFATGMIAAYVLGRLIQSVWASASNKDWFSQALPRLAAVPDDDKGSYGLVLGGLIALIGVVRTYRKPDVRAWTDEVASELTKVKWPTRKEVQSSTVIVIAASAVATIYLALLDRFWAFLTSLVYGDGS